MATDPQYSCLDHLQGQKSLASYSPWSRKMSDSTERISVHTQNLCRPGYYFPQLGEPAGKGQHVRTTKCLLLNTHLANLLLESLQGPAPVVQRVKRLPTLRESGFDSWAGGSPGDGNGNPLQYSCLENPMDRGAW